MIISYRHRFIFIHSRKVAGSSISAYLARFLGPEDILIGAWGYAYRAGVRPNRRAWRDMLHPEARAALFKEACKRPGRFRSPSRRVALINQCQKTKYRNVLGPNPEHPKAQAIRDFDPEAWRSFYKFCFVRNPFDRLVSDYTWRRKLKDRQDVTFSDFLTMLTDPAHDNPLIPRNAYTWPMYTIDDRVAVDRVGRYENLYADLDAIAADIGLPALSGRLPNAKQAASGAAFREWYGPSERARVEALFEKELAAFGYTF